MTNLTGNIQQDLEILAKEQKTIRVKKLHPDAVIPKYQSAGASGFDLHALEEVTLLPGETHLVKTGVAFQIPANTEIQVRPRSGLSAKTKLRVCNSPGTVDSDYTGECVVIMENTTPRYFGIVPNSFGGITIKKGDRIAQAVLCPVIRADIEEVEELDKTDRGNKGFGSTGQ